MSVKWLEPLKKNFKKTALKPAGIGAKLMAGHRSRMADPARQMLSLNLQSNAAGTLAGTQAPMSGSDVMQQGFQAKMMSRIGGGTGKPAARARPAVGPGTPKAPEAAPGMGPASTGGVAPGTAPMAAATQTMAMPKLKLQQPGANGMFKLNVLRRMGLES